ncbi:MAG: hypothetical protein ACXABY_01135 [Candidatus Thorarchaeota archaeon]|jgi:hypothetical protein
MNAKKKYKRTCHFCSTKIEKGVKGTKYIYPVPEKYGLRPNDGVYACHKCAPGILVEQQAEGQMLVSERRPLTS